MAYTDIRFGTLLRDHLDGIPLDLASKLLPRRTRLRLGLRGAPPPPRTRPAAVRRRGGRGRPRGGMSRSRQDALLTSLRTTVEKLEWQPGGHRMGRLRRTHELRRRGDRREGPTSSRRYLRDAGSQAVWDLGANTGTYSRIAADEGAGCSPSTSTRPPPSGPTGR